MRTMINCGIIASLSVRRTMLCTFCFALLALCLASAGSVHGGTYTSTVHGNSTLRTSPASGVDRSAVTGSAYPDASAYAKGHCGHCHEGHASIGGAEPSPAGDSENPYALFKENFATYKNELCYACHETFGAAYGQPAGYGRFGVYVGKTNYNNSVHYSSTSMVWPSGSTPAVPYSDYGNCHNCHNPHGYNDGSGVIPSMLLKREEALCNECHDGSPVTKNVKTLVTTKTYKHNVGGYSNLHLPGWVTGQETRAYLSTANAGKKHVECTDCHNPHVATAAAPTAGAPGVNPTNSATNFAAPTGYTERNITGGIDEYQICFRCHSSYISTITYDGTSYTGTWNDAGKWTDLAREFNVNNASFHWVEGDKGAPKASTTYGNFNITGNAYAYKMMPRYNGYTNAQLRSVAMRCSDCHGPDNFGTTVPNGPHGSTYAKILKVPSGSSYTVWNSVSKVGDTNIWCFNCHDPNFTNSGFSGSEGSLHTSKHSGDACMDCHVKIPHGWQTPRLGKLYGLSTTSPYQGEVSTTGISLSGGTWKASGSWAESSCKGPAGHQNCTN